MERVSHAFASSVICDRRSLYEGLVRNQLYCPSLKDSIMTIDFMKGAIGHQKYWLPRTAEIKLLNCCDPPSKQEIAVVLCEVMVNHPIEDAVEPFASSFIRTAQEVRKKPPSKTWMLAVLSTMSPDHQFFKKDFIKPKVVFQGQIVQEAAVFNPDGFFDGLPT